MKDQLIELIKTIDNPRFLILIYGIAKAFKNKENDDKAVD